MNIQYFCPLWGNLLPFEDFCKNVKAAGYNGVEMDLPFDEYEKNTILLTLKKHNLLLIGQYWQSLEKDFHENAKSYKKYLLHLADAKPILINTQTGKDYFSFEQNMELIALAESVSEQTGIEIVHETHRGKFFYNIPVFKRSVASNKNIKLALDISHWCTVHESFLEDQSEGVALALNHTRHLHSRIGHTQSPQLNDPRAPEWKETVDIYLKWWDELVLLNNKKNQPLTITTEFGPYPYMPAMPYTQAPLSVQWDVNVYMLAVLKNRYPY